jgi:integrase
MALSDFTVRQARATGKNYTLKDADGLALFVSASGAKTWHFRFYWAGQQQRISFGNYPEIGIKDARALRDEARALVAKEIDPRVHRRAARTAQASAAHTFESVFQVWRDFKAMSLKAGRQSTLSQINRIFGKDILPALQNLSIFDIKRQDLLEVIRKIERRKALTTAGKCRTWFNQLFRFAMVELNLPENPAADMDIVAMPQLPVKHNPFLRMPEIPAFLRALHDYGGNTKTRLGIWLLLLTGVRTGELRSATPEQIDLERGLWIIPPENVKQLQKMLRTEDRDVPPYIVPLSRQAIEIFRHLLAEVHPAQHYLLTHRSDLKKRISENTLNGALKRMGYENQLTGHGIRATLSTALNEIGYKKEWVDAQLSHANPDQISAAYNHAEYVEQRRVMMQDWADRLDTWANPHEDHAEASTTRIIDPPLNAAHADAEPAGSALLNDVDSIPISLSSPMTIIGRRDQRPQPVQTDLQRARAVMLETYEAPHNLSLSAFAKLAGKSRHQINRDIKAGRLLTLNMGNRGQRIPDWQLAPACQQFIHQVMQRAKDIDSWSLYRALAQPSEMLEGKAPVDALLEGKTRDAATLVYAELGLD